MKPTNSKAERPIGPVDVARAEAIYALAKPLARLAQSTRVPATTLLKVVREALLRVGEEECERNDMRATAQFLLLTTALTRPVVEKYIKEPQSIDDFLLEVVAEAASVSTYARVLRRWLEDEKYCNADGTPRDLPKRGKDSWEELVKSAGVSVTHQPLLKDLVASGSVSVVDDRVRLLNTEFTHTPPPERIMEIRVEGETASDILLRSFLSGDSV